jgi:hypothetical protein
MFPAFQIPMQQVYFLSIYEDELYIKNICLHPSIVICLLRNWEVFETQSWLTTSPTKEETLRHHSGYYKNRQQCTFYLGRHLLASRTYPSFISISMSGSFSNHNSFLCVQWLQLRNSNLIVYLHVLGQIATVSWLVSLEKS